MVLISNLINDTLNISNISSNKYTEAEYLVNKNIGSLTDFKHNTLVMRSDNLLVSLFSVLPISVNLDINRNIMSLYDSGLEASGILGLTTAYRSGKDHYRVIFSGDCVERWVAYLGDYDDSTPVRCHYHPYSSLNLWMDEETEDSGSDGISLFTVNIVGLVAGYFKRAKVNPGIAPSTYIRENIISNVIRDVANITMFNKFNLFIEGVTPYHESVRITPYWVDAYVKVQAGITQLMDLLYRGSGSPSEIIVNLKLTMGDDLKTVLDTIPYMPTTKPVMPDYLSIELPYVIFVLSLASKIGRTNVSPILNKIKTTLRTLERDNTLTMGSPSVQANIINSVKKINMLG